jgi:hypothetical protein
LSFPPIVERDPCAYEEHDQDNRNDHSCGLARRGRCCRCSRRGGRAGSRQRRPNRRSGYSRVRDRVADRLSCCRLGNGRCCRFLRLY